MESCYNLSNILVFLSNQRSASTFINFSSSSKKINVKPTENAPKIHRGQLTKEVITLRTKISNTVNQQTEGQIER